MKSIAQGSKYTTSSIPKTETATDSSYVEIDLDESGLVAITLYCDDEHYWTLADNGTAAASQLADDDYRFTAPVGTMVVECAYNENKLYILAKSGGSVKVSYVKNYLY